MADIPVGRVTSLVRTAPARFSVTGSVPIKGLLDRERADGAREEREAVVRWLRTYANAMDEHLADILADEIADGSHRLEHRKEAPDA